MTKRAVSIAEQLGLQQTLDADSAYALGHELLEDGSEADYPTALIFFRIAAEAGVPEAQNDLATMLRNGYGCDRDIPQAIEWYEASAAQGLSTALYNLGLLYLHGVGVRFDKPKAARYLEQAAGAGHSEARCDLGTMLRLGDGVARDIVRAAWLHLAAAEDGDVVALGNLCSYSQELVRPALDGNLSAARALHRVYRDGYGCSADTAQAWSWIRWAHDVCLPQSGESWDHESASVYSDYAEALQAIGPAARRNGDNGLEPIIDEHGTSLRPAWQPILVCGAEGGSVTLLGRWGWTTGWAFCRQIHDGSLAMFDEGDVIQHDSNPVQTWREAMQLMDAYRWHRLHGVHVHPEFRTVVRRSWARRCTREGLRAPTDSWRQVLGLAE